VYFTSTSALEADPSAKLVNPVATPTAVRWIESPAAVELVTTPMFPLLPFQAPPLQAAAISS